MSDLRYRIRTEASSNKNMAINVPISGTFDMFEILSLQLSQRNFYKLPKSGYGVLIGRVLANGGFGIPNAKVSVFIPYEGDGTDDDYDIYPYSTVTGINYDRVRYNLLQSDIDDPCHQDVGTFPTKRYMLDNGAVIDVFDKYYKYTTSTNKAGDYMIYGVPVGMNTLHVDIDLSDIGVLSQTPRDMIYKGYNINQFESPTKFRKSENLNSLAQIYSQNKAVYVYPFWGDTTETTTDAAVTRCDIKVDYKFEPTCVFMGSVVTDSGSDGIGKRCTPSKNAGKMSNLRAGEGMIEMIRKTPTGKVESFSVQGNKLIDGDGVWCYQIPMNLDYVMTDEFGNLVPTDDPENGIPTRARVRFRVSMSETGEEGVGYKRARYLIPNNPKLDADYTDEDIDYEFGTLTKEESYRDLFWNHVYTVKSYIPRLQKSPLPDTKNYTAIKATNHPGDNNPMPYNNIQIKLNFLYRINCMLAFVVISIVTMLNIVLTGIGKIAYLISGGTSSAGRVILAILTLGLSLIFGKIWKAIGCGIELRGMCDDNSRYFPGCGWTIPLGFFNNHIDAMNDETGMNLNDEGSDDGGNYRFSILGSITGRNYVRKVEEYIGCDKCIVNNPKDLMECAQSNLAEENEVVSLNFQNDWVNGSIYMPLWGRKIRKRKYNILGYSINRYKDVFCNSLSDTYINRKIDDNYAFFNRVVSPKNLKLYQTCAIWRDKFFNHTNPQPLGSFKPPVIFTDPLTTIEMYTEIGGNSKEETCFGFNCDKVPDYVNVNAGVITERSTMLGEEVYYYKPSGIKDANTPVRLFATDIVLLGNLDSCDESGTPQFFKKLPSSTYKLPPNLVLDEEESSEADINLPDGDNSRFTVSNIGQKNVKERTEQTGCDWGKTGKKQKDRANILGVTTPLRAGGLFYGITCNYTSVSPKSCVNLSRICEYGVSLDEAKYIYTSSDSDEPQYLAPDGFISTDEIDDPDGRSMFATLNGNLLKTKENPKTGYLEYDFDYSYQHWFDGSLSGIMKEYQRDLDEQYKYKNNYKLEQGSPDYIRFRYGDEVPRSFGTSIKYNGPFMHFGSNFPDYNNSFYFYFGLKEGKTAIDKFRTLYYSECEDDKESDTTNVQFEPNSWCAEATASPDVDNNDRRTGDGYILLDLSYVDTPYSLVINSMVDNTYDYTLTNITYPKIYLGPDSTNNFEGYETLKDVNGRDICLINGMYEFTVINPDNDETSFNVNFVKETLSFSVDKEDFTISDDIIFNPSNGYCVCGNPETESYYCVASYKEGNDRVIGGTVTISGIQNPEGSYRIVLKPQPGYAFNDLPNAQDTYTGEIFDVINGQPDPNYPEGLYGTILSFDNGEIVIGVPKGNVSYTVNITELCGDNSNILSRNTSSSSVYILSFVQPVMYINGVDSRLIEYFRTGWNTNGTNPEFIGGGDDWKDWASERIDDIGGDDVHLLPTEPGNLLPWEDVSFVIDAITIDDTVRNSYNWTDEYAYDEDTAKSYCFVPSVNSIQAFTNYQDGTPVDITVLTDETLEELEWNDIFGEGVWPEYFKSLKQDGINYKYFALDGDHYQTKPTQNVTPREFYESSTTTDENKVVFINYINRIVSLRIELPLLVKQAFWVSGETKDILVESTSERVPVKYSVFGSVFDDSDSERITHTFGILDENKEENSFVCYYPHVSYDDNGDLVYNEVTTYETNGGETPQQTKPRPYYCATKDSSGITTPSDFDTVSFDTANTLYGMSQFLLFKRPFTADIVSWSYVRYPDLDGGTFTEKKGILDASIKNGILANSFSGRTFVEFSEQKYGDDNVKIATMDYRGSGLDTKPFEYAYPVNRRLYNEETESVYGEYEEIRVIEGGLQYNKLAYHAIGDGTGVLKIDDGTHVISENVYGGLRVVTDYGRNTELENSGLYPDYEIGFRHKIGDFYGCLTYLTVNVPTDDISPLSSFGAFYYENGGSGPVYQYPLYGGDLSLITNYNLDYFKSCVENDTFFLSNPLKEYNGDTPHVFELTDNGGQTDSFYIVAAVGINDHNFACYYSPLYEYKVSNLGIWRNGRIAITATNSYLRNHKCTIQVTNLDDNSVIFNKDNISLSFSASDIAFYYVDGGFDNSVSNVRVSVFDATGFEHYKDITIQ